MQLFLENYHFIFQALVILKLLVLPIDRPVACSVRIAMDRHTHTQTKYYITRIPRVNNLNNRKFNSLNSTWVKDRIVVIKQIERKPHQKIS